MVTALKQCISSTWDYNSLSVTALTMMHAFSVKAHMLLKKHPRTSSTVTTQQLRVFHNRIPARQAW